MDVDKDLRQKVVFFQKEIEKSIETNREDSDLDIIDLEKQESKKDKK